MIIYCLANYPINLKEDQKWSWFWRLCGRVYTPLTPPLYRKTGVYRGIPIFLIFAPKHRLWVLVRTASARRFQHVPTIYVLSKNKKNNQFFPMKFSTFASEKLLCILHGQVFVMGYAYNGVIFRMLLLIFVI